MVSDLPRAAQQLQFLFRLSGASKGVPNIRVTRDQVLYQNNISHGNAELSLSANSTTYGANRPFGRRFWSSVFGIDLHPAVVTVPDAIHEVDDPRACSERARVQLTYQS